ncbi:sugar ABC transporter ATP-binding protein [bacterium]|nr:sugar ABC transporter ATP-binding protein [bacterium]
MTKHYPGVTALDAVSLDLRLGEVHALVGENGAGKTTLTGVLTGALHADAGEVFVAGKSVKLDSPAAARKLGIVGISQELAIEPYLTVSDNIVLGQEPTVGPGHQVLSRRLADSTATRALASLGASDVPLGSTAGRLSTARKQLVEIARALALDARVILMDEPTSSLPGSDASKLLELIRELRADAKAILFISHRLEEVIEIADRVTVVRSGRKIATLPIEEAPIDRMIELMVGRSIKDFFPPRRSLPGDVVLEIEGMSRDPEFHDVSLSVRSGEILGLAGLVGAGRTEVMRAVAGADPRDAGTIRLHGDELDPASPSDSIAAGIVYLPEDRTEQGLVLTMSVLENIALPSMARLTQGWGLLRRARVQDLGRQWCSKLGVRGRIEGSVANLSGGNRQKVVIAKWVATTPQVLIFDEPTRGIDVGAKREVFEVMHELAAGGAAIVFVSSEIPELMNVAHRIIVMSAGRVTDELQEHEFDEERILTAAFAAHVERKALT